MASWPQKRRDRALWSCIEQKNIAEQRRGSGEARRCSRPREIGSVWRRCREEMLYRASAGW